MTRLTNEPSFARLDRRERLSLRFQGLNEQEQADCGQGQVDVFEERVALEAVVEGAAEEYGSESEGERNQVVVGDGGYPESGEPVAGHSDEAGGQEISLQGGTEVRRGPAAHGSVDHQRRAVHAIGSAEDAGGESTDEEPETAIAFEDERGAADEGIDGKHGDDHA